MADPAPKARGWRARALAAAKVALALGLVAVLAAMVDAREMVRLLLSADPAWLALGLAALTVQTVLSARRWQIAAAQLDHGFALRVALREYYLSQIVNQTLPGGMLGDAGRAVRARGPAGLGNASLAVALERLAGQLGMVAIMAVGLVATVLLPGGLTPPGWIAAVVAMISAGLLATGLVLGLSKALPGRAGRGVAAALQAARRAILAPEVLAQHVALSLATAACNLVAFAACARAIGAALPPGAVTVLVPLVLFAMLIPLTVSGWGLREGAAAALLPLAGLSGAQAMASSVAFGLVFLIAVLPGLWPLLTLQVAAPIHTRTHWQKPERTDRMH
jgi:uncharacterized membrane protein YbhN (UPF0104 family)